MLTDIEMSKLLGLDPNRVEGDGEHITSKIGICSWCKKEKRIYRPIYGNISWWCRECIAKDDYYNDEHSWDTLNDINLLHSFYDY